MSFNEDWNLSYPFINDDLGDGFLLVRGRTAGGGSAGQFEIAGSSHLPDGTQIAPSDIDGKQIAFQFRMPSMHNHISISTEYPVSIVGGKVRISIQGRGGNRPNIGNLFAVLLLMPDVGKVNDSAPLRPQGFFDKTYWVDTVQTRVVEKAGDTLVLCPERMVLATGSKSDAGQFSGAMFFDFTSRIIQIRDVCRASEKAAAGGVPAALKYFADVYDGNAVFDYAIGAFMREIVMQYLKDATPDYSYGSDPLPALISAIGAPLRAAQTRLPFSDKPYIDRPHNWVFFGAPGTGKSYELDKLGVKTKDNPEGLFPEDHVRRVTFYPDYTYSQFVGSYRPFSKDDKIGYHYIAGPFLKTCIEASTHPYDNYLLIIEELNRANPAAVFGDVFQLLDRDADGASEYCVSVPMEMAACIKESLDKLDDFEKRNIESFFDPDMGFDDFCESMLCDLSLPPNMYIWATMNSADQGVFPMDTAFKRRWDFRYMGIDKGENATPLALGGERLDKHDVGLNGARVIWNKVRRAINTLLLDCGVNEDKLLGPFFLSPDALSDEPYGGEDKSRFVAAFEDKVLLYLYEDAGKMRRRNIFRNGDATFADICTAFERDGLDVFTQGTDKHHDIFVDVFAPIEVPGIVDQDGED